LGHDEAVHAFEQNVSALAIAAELFPPGTAVILGVVLNIFAVATAFFGVYLGFEEATKGVIKNLFGRGFVEEKISDRWISHGIKISVILLAFTVIRLDIPVLYFTSFSSPIFGLIGCLIPAWLVIKVPALSKYKNLSLAIIILTGLLLIISPFIAFI
jgi:amino acid permease